MKSSNKIIGLLVESKTRELKSKMLLAAEFIHHGYDVVIGDHDTVRWMASEGQLNGIIDKDASERRSDLWAGAKKNGVKIFVLDEEGMIYGSDEIYLDERCGNTSMELLDMFFLWGESHKDTMRKKFNNYMNKMAVVGNPRFDFLGKNIHYFYGDHIEEIRKKYEGYIMVILSFSSVDPEVLISIIENHSKVKLSDKERLHYQNACMHENALKEHAIEGIKKLAGKTDRLIIVRPHPGDITDYKNVFQGYDNIIVNAEGDAVAWSYGADAVIHMGSTVAVEAFICGKKSIIYYPFYDEQFYKHFPNDISMKAVTDDELCNCVKDILESKITDEMFFTEEKRNMVNSKINYLSDELSTKRMVHEILPFFDNDTLQTNPLALNRHLKIIDIKKGIKSFLGDRSCFERTGKAEIEDLITKAGNLLHYDQKVHVKKIAYNVFKLTGDVQ